MKAIKTILLFSMAVLALVLSASFLGVRLNLPGAALASTEHEYRTVFVSAPIVEGEEDLGWKQVDEKEFTANLRLALNKLTYEGFELVEVTPITRGRLDTGGVRHGTWGGGYGITQGLVIIAKKPAS